VLAGCPDKLEELRFQSGKVSKFQSEANFANLKHAWQLGNPGTSENLRNPETLPFCHFATLPL
jgi:hypothetical protein